MTKIFEELLEELMENEQKISKIIGRIWSWDLRWKILKESECRKLFKKTKENSKNAADIKKIFKKLNWQKKF